MLSRLNVLKLRAIQDWKNIIELYSIFRDQFAIRLLLLVLLRFSGKFFNMLVMFLPLKIFLVLSGTTQVGFLKDVEVKLGTNGYVVLVLSLTAFLYITNTLIQVYYSRLLNEEKLKFVKNDKAPDADVKRYKSFFYYYVDFLSGLVLVFISLVLFSFLSIHYFLLFSMFFLAYYFFVQYFLFTDNKYKFLDRVKISVKQAVDVSSGIFFLFVFFLVFSVYIEFGLSVVSALLLLLLSRLANSAIKTIFSSMPKFRL